MYQDSFWSEDPVQYGLLNFKTNTQVSGSHSLVLIITLADIQYESSAFLPTQHKVELAASTDRNSPFYIYMLQNMATTLEISNSA